MCIYILGMKERGKNSTGRCTCRLSLCSVLEDWAPNNGTDVPDEVHKQ